MYKIATLNKISPVGLKELPKELYEVADGAKDEKALSEAQGILVRSQDMLEMKFSDSLLAIARAGAGYNNIPIKRCAEEGICVFNTPGANANAVKELVLAVILADARNIIAAKSWVAGISEQENLIKLVEKGKGQFAGHEILGKTICIYGLGAIGYRVANACEALGMKVRGYDPYLSVEAAHSLSNTIPILNDVTASLKDCDYVSVHVPAIDSTKNLIDAEFIAKMKDGAILINFSRETVAEEKAVLDALNSGKVSRYITDFTTNEIYAHPNSLCTPHLGASTEEAEDNCAAMAARELRDYIENGNIVHSVNLPDCSLGKLTKKARICIINRNVSGILGKITAHLTELRINIDNMINKNSGDFAYTMIDVDSDIDEKALREALLKDEGIISVRVIKG